MLYSNLHSFCFMGPRRKSGDSDGAVRLDPADRPWTIRGLLIAGPADSAAALVQCPRDGGIRVKARVKVTGKS